MSGSRSASALPATAKRLQVGPLHKIHQNTTQLPPLVSSHLLSSFSSSFSSLPSSSPGASRNSQVPIYGTLRQLVGNRIRAGVSSCP